MRRRLGTLPQPGMVQQDLATLSHHPEQPTTHVQLPYTLNPKLVLHHLGRPLGVSGPHFQLSCIGPRP